MIDKSPFSTNKFDVPMHINYTPDAIAISNENMIVYCKNDFSGSKIISELVLYDIELKTRKVIAQTNNVIQELIVECHIDGGNIVWSKFRELNESYEYRFTRYKYSDLFIYNLKTGQTEQLTKDDFYHNPYIYEDKLVAIYATPNKPGQNAYNSEVVFLDLNERKILSIVHEDSPCYKEKADEMVRVNPKINSRYISWNNSVFSNRFVFDYKNNKFLELYDGKDDTWDNIIVLDNMFDNHALFNINSSDGTTTKFCVTVKDAE